MHDYSFSLSGSFSNSRTQHALLQFFFIQETAFEQMLFSVMAAIFELVYGTLTLINNRLLI